MLGGRVENDLDSVEGIAGFTRLHVDRDRSGHTLRTRVRIKGSHPYARGSESRLILRESTAGGTRIEWDVLGPARVREVPKLDPIIVRQTDNATRLVERWNLLSGMQASVEVVLVEAGADVDLSRTDRFGSRPAFTFYGVVDGNSSQSFEDALVEMMGTVVHELVHFSLALNDASVPGRDGVARLVNEEAIASALHSCARIQFLRDAESGTPRIMLPKVEWVGFPLLQEYAATYGASVVGGRLAHEILMDHRPTGGMGDWVLDEADSDRLLDACTAILNEPGDYWGRRQRDADATP